jgi:hypothetical protein
MGKPMNEQKKTVELDSTGSSWTNVELNGEGVHIVKCTILAGTDVEEVSKRTKVIMGNFKLERKLELDGEDVFEITTQRTFRGDAEEVMRQLRKEGAIVNRARASDCLNALLKGGNLPVEKGHASYGVFVTEEGKLELCYDPYPRTETQQQIKKQVHENLKERATLEVFNDWIKTQDFWHGYEAYPIMGSSIMAPFNLVLKDHGQIVAYLYHISPESGLGKTFIAVLFTKELFGNRTLSADAVNSNYRLADAQESAGLLFVVEEAQSFDWKRFAVHLQQSAEQPQQDRRGTSSLGSRIYWSRSNFAFTGNFFPHKAKAMLVRMIKVPFDLTQLRERDKRKIELGELKAKLRPIGFRVVEAELERVEWDIKNLMSNIQIHAIEIEKLYGSFKDPRRASIYGYVYEGLKGWEALAIKLGSDWRVPSYEDFVSCVVRKIEPEMFESMEVPVTEFIAWWESWKAKNTQIKTYREESVSSDVHVIKGEGSIWREATERINGEELEGEVVTYPVLQLYESENRFKGPSVSISLADIGKGIEALAKLPYEEVYRTRRFGKKTKKSIFIPNNIVRGGIFR